MAIEITDEMIELARRALKTCSCEGCVGRALSYTAPLIEAQARALMIEEAAQVAETWLKGFGNQEITVVSARDWANIAVRDVRDAIRDLAALAGEKANG